MTPREAIPAFLKPPLRAVYRTVGPILDRLRQRSRSRDELHAYWRSPVDEGNAPEQYVELGHERSAFLVDLAQRHIQSDSTILEIGCNAGRNLDYLFRAGFTRLTAVEISERAVDVLKRTYPDVARRASIHVGAVEDSIGTFADDQFDLVFTMAVLEHIHGDSAWVFGEIARIGRTLITIEDERTRSWRHFPRHYGRIFTRLGVEEVEQISPVPGMGAPFVARVFRHVP